MECWESGTSSASFLSSPARPLSSSPPPSTVVSPCAACKILRRKCLNKCVLAPYFPPSEPHNFAIAHRVFGASNIIKLLQELPEARRADAVTSIVYEANARLRDPVYGCTGAICQLQKQIIELQSELAKAQAEILNMKCQNASLAESFICQEKFRPQGQQDQQQPNENYSPFFLDENIWGFGLGTTTDMRMLD